MIPNRLSELATEAAGRYEILTMTWEALFNRALSSPDFGKSGQAAMVAAEAYETASAYLIAERGYISEQLAEIASEAHLAVKAKIASNDADELSVAALEHLSETESYLHDEIVAQVHRDNALIRQSLQHAGLVISMMARTRRIPRRQAVMEYRYHHSLPIDFHFTDRRARRTPSRTFIAAVWRQALLSAHNEVTLMAIADHGIERAAILKLESGVEVQTGLISLTGEGDLPGYEEIRSTLFHPNSNAYLGMELADV